MLGTRSPEAVGNVCTPRMHAHTTSIGDIENEYSKTTEFGVGAFRVSVKLDEVVGAIRLRPFRCRVDVVVGLIRPSERPIIAIQQNNGVPGSIEVKRRH
jgi:hypothetical protein